ncbi:hypothetical protein GCM10010399_51020 [Dactylosporangium fulvum]|uniref:hypothetical protein n=1 Tax=Dactylosporangium fulvum TaxID=53359 RepID=UPI0031D55BE5
MARLRSRIERAAAQHRHTAALVAAAGPILDKYSPTAAPVDQYAEQHDLAAGLRADAALLAPGWLGARLDALAPATPLGGPLPPTFVRVGQAHPLDDARFPVVVPLLRAGHIAVDADARDSRVAGLLRSLVLRLLASSPPGSVRIRTIDAVEGATFSWFTGIESIMPPPATDAEGLRAVLDEGEQWLASRTDGPGPTLLIVIASLPELTEGRDLARIAGLAHAGPAGRLHLIAAGWPPPPLTAETTQAPLPHATQIAIRNPHAWVGDPPGTTFSGTGVAPARLNAPVYLDPDPPAELVRRVCAELGGPWNTPPTPVGEPSRTAWLEYVAAAQRLDVVRREVIAVVAEHKAALKAARDDLAAVRAKLAHHRAFLAEVAGEAGGRPIEYEPSWQETQAARAALTSAQQPAGRGRGAPMAPPPPPSSGGPAMGWQQGTRTATLPVSAPPISAPPLPPGTPAAPRVSGLPASAAHTAASGMHTGRTPGVHTGTIPGMPVTGPIPGAPPAPVMPQHAMPGTPAGTAAHGRHAAPMPGTPAGPQMPPAAMPGTPSGQAPATHGRHTAAMPGTPAAIRGQHVTAMPGTPAAIHGRPAAAMPGTPAGPRVPGAVPMAHNAHTTGSIPRIPVSGTPATGGGGAVGTGAVRPVSPPAPESVPGRVSTALRVAAAGLKQSEAALSAPGRQAASARRVWLNAAVYFCFAILAAIVQIPTLLAGERSSQVSIVALPCALVLPAIAFGLGWLTIGAMTRHTTSRTPVLGMVISLLALIPLLVFGGVLLLTP